MSAASNVYQTTRQPRRLLDLFCGAGGASMGYARAGFTVTGVDIEAHPDYPFQMLEADAMAVLADPSYLDRFAVVHASPPCQAYTPLGGDGHPDLVRSVLDFLTAWGGPFVVENVPRAQSAFGPVPTVNVCGSSFGLKVRRHRLFGSHLPLAASECRHKEQGQPLGVYGQLTNPVHSTRPQRGRKAQGLAEASEAMGIDWMDRADIVEAIPPAFSEFIGRQVIDHLLEVAA